MGKALRTPVSVLIQLDFFDEQVTLVNWPKRKKAEKKAPPTLKEQLELVDLLLKVDQTEKFEWTDNDIVLMHAGLLEQSLHQLADNRTGDATRKDVLAWMNAPEEKVPLPFSFQLCCLFDGCDPEDVRERALWIMRRSLKEKRAAVLAA